MPKTGLALDFELTRPAKRGGGDRYECTIKTEKNPIVFYVPQSISRDSKGASLLKLTVTISQGG